MCLSFLLSLHCIYSLFLFFFFFNVTAPTEIYTLSLHDALPILGGSRPSRSRRPRSSRRWRTPSLIDRKSTPSELQSPDHLVCRLLLEKKKTLRSWNSMSLKHNGTRNSRNS